MTPYQMVRKMKLLRTRKEKDMTELTMTLLRGRNVQKYRRQMVNQSDSLSKTFFTKARFCPWIVSLFTKWTCLKRTPPSIGMPATCASLALVLNDNWKQVGPDTQNLAALNSHKTWYKTDCEKKYPNILTFWNGDVRKTLDLNLEIMPCRMHTLWLERLLFFEGVEVKGKSHQ